MSEQRDPSEPTLEEAPTQPSVVPSASTAEAGEGGPPAALEIIAEGDDGALAAQAPDSPTAPTSDGLTDDDPEGSEPEVSVVEMNDDLNEDSLGVGATGRLAVAVHNFPAPSSDEKEARARIERLEREARAMGDIPEAALLFHEIGLLWEEPLGNARNAAVAFQNAYRLNPAFLSNLRAARRLFSEVGNWQMVVQLLDAQISAVHEPRQRAALLIEKAAVLEQRLSREAAATETYRTCEALEPADPSVLIALESAFSARNDLERLVAVQKRLAATLQEPALRAHYLTSAAILSTDRLKRADEAAALFREAFALDRHNPLLLSAMERLAEREGETDELTDVLLAQAQRAGSRSAPYYLRIARSHERQGRPDDALTALLAARRASPDDALVLAELARIYEAQERHEDLADTLAAWCDSASDEAEVEALHLRLAALYEEILRRDDEAIARYRALLERSPGHTTALAGLGKLYHRTQHWEGLAEVFELESSSTEEPKLKAAKLYKCGEVLEERLGRTEEAIARYAQCLQLQPGFLAAQKSLARLYEQAGRFEDLIGLYEQDLDQTGDREQSIATLDQMATLYEDKLEDRERAEGCLRRILELSADHLPTLRRLGRLYEAGEKWRELIQINEREATVVADTRQVLSLHHRSAEILEEELQDRPKAIIAYERLLSISPSYLPALRSLGRLYARDGRWDDLIRMYRAESEIASSTEQAAGLIYKIGELYEHTLKDDNQAIASYQEVLTLAPAYFPALRALARMYRGQEAWESLVDVLRSEAANRTDPLERANTLFQAAGIWEDRLKRSDLAIEGFQEVLRLTPTHAPAMRALERLYTSRDDTAELIRLLDLETQVAKDPDQRLCALLKLAYLYLDRLDEAPKAARCCESALELDPKNLVALKMLERIRSGDRPRRAELRTRLADQLTDQKLATALRLSAIGDTGGDTSGMVDELEQAYAESRGDVRLGLSLERALRLAGDPGRLAELYDRRLEELEDGEEKVELALRLGNLAARKLHQPERALRAYRTAIALSPSLLPALQGAREVLLAQGDHHGAREMLEAEGTVCRDAQSAIEALLQAGALCEQELEDLDGALIDYTLAFERDPLRPEARGRLDALLEAHDRTAQRATLRERVANAHLVRREGAEASKAFLEAATLLMGEMPSLSASAAQSGPEGAFVSSDGSSGGSAGASTGSSSDSSAGASSDSSAGAASGDTSEALRLLDRALEADPTSVEALEAKAALCIQTGDHAAAAETLSERVRQGGAPAALSRAHLTLGALHHDHLDDPGRAAAHLQTALSSDPESAEALRRLSHLHVDGQNWAAASDCLERLTALSLEPAALAAALVTRATVAERGFDDPATAATHLRQAVDLLPGEVQLVDRLLELYERIDDLGGFVEVLERQAQLAAGTGDVARAVELRLRKGGVLAGPLHRSEEAITTYRKVVELDPRCAAAHAALANLYAAEPGQESVAIAEHLETLQLDIQRLDSLHALFKLHEAQGETDRAFCVASVLHFLRAARDEEAAFYSEVRGRLPADPSGVLDVAAIDAILHPNARNAVTEVLRVIGDQLGKLHPPQLEALGIERRSDRLKPDHAVHKAVRSVAQLFALDDLEVFQARRGLVTVENTSPPAVCVGQDVVRRFNAREQRFLLAEGLFTVLNKASVLSKLSGGETADLLANAVRLHVPDFNGFGRPNDELMKQLRRACSRKALKALEGPAVALAGTDGFEVEGWVAAIRASARRAGAVVCGDPGLGLGVALKELNPGAERPQTTDEVMLALEGNPELAELAAFTLSDELAELRKRLQTAV